jgi:multisubunit Na+/H+ antiporter MnhE subunit
MLKRQGLLLSALRLTALLALLLQRTEKRQERQQLASVRLRLALLFALWLLVRLALSPLRLARGRLPERLAARLARRRLRLLLPAHNHICPCRARMPP